MDKEPGRAPLNSMRAVGFEYLTVGGILRVVGRAEGQAFRGRCDGLPRGWLLIQIANATFEEFGIQLRAYRFVIFMVAMVFSTLVVVAAWAFELTRRVSGPLSWRRKGNLRGERLLPSKEIGSGSRSFSGPACLLSFLECWQQCSARRRKLSRLR